MRGDHCKRALFTALTPISGISTAEVALGRITVEHDGTVTEQELREAIAVTGYVIADITEDRRTLPVMGDPIQSHHAEF